MEYTTSTEPSHDNVRNSRTTIYSGGGFKRLKIRADVAGNHFGHLSDWNECIRLLPRTKEHKYHGFFQRHDSAGEIIRCPITIYSKGSNQ